MDCFCLYTSNRRKEAPIAVFDSGVGGISVLRALLQEMPNENYWYYGDSANAPYGTKSLEEVRRLTVSHVDRFIEEGAKAVVVACNTATSAAVRYLRQKYPTVPLIGIEPALKPAVLFKNHPNVVVMAPPKNWSVFWKNCLNPLKNRNWTPWFWAARTIRLSAGSCRKCWEAMLRCLKADLARQERLSGALRRPGF